MNKESHLILSLKKEWFEKIKAGIKKEEYRELKSYYGVRFCKKVNQSCKKDDYCKCAECEPFSPKQFSTITFTCGYPKKEDSKRRITFQNPKIRIGKGNPDWGAENEKKYFILTWDN